MALVYAVSLSFYKGSMLRDFSQVSARSLQARHPAVLSLFQASFYFFYEDQFLPGVRQAIVQTPGLERIQVLSGAGALLFDSLDPPRTPGAQDTSARPFPYPEVVSRLGVPGPSLFVSGFRLQILMPAGQYGILYTFDGSAIRNRLLGVLLGGVLLAVALAWLLARTQAFGAFRQAFGRTRAAWQRFWGLRFKFLFTIVLINVITGVIVFFTLSELQTREQTNRIQKESILFSQFSTAQVISDFSNFFYFYYPDRFLPGIKTIISTNENLMSVRIISRRTRSVLFDSEQAVASGPTAALPAGSTLADFSEETEAELKTRDVVTRNLTRDGERLFSVINTYRNENQEGLFYVEYLFSFQTLIRSIHAIRRQILVDLIPSLGLGLLIAIVFAQLLISPIRRLVAAFQRVSAGDYDTSVAVDRTDEVGELITAFNSMTGELKKKQELRKFLSDSTYRQIMEAPDLPGKTGSQIGGTRVAATVLFSDIRGFVAHCENLDAEEVTAMLNEYFTEMVDVVHKNGGEVDKFIGDALLAVFYATDDYRTIRSPDRVQGPSATTTALQAIYCALEMRERLGEFNRRRLALHKNTLEIGVGITHGEIISGPIGSKDRMDFTVIGDVVNLANRIEKLSKTGKHTKIVFSNHVEEKIRGLLEYEEFTHEKIRGKEEEITVYELVRVRDLHVLVENLTGSDLPLRRRSVELLGQSRNREAIPHVVKAMHDPDVELRLQSVLAIIKLSDQDNRLVIDSLLSLLQDEKSDKVQSALIAAVGRLCTSERILELAPFLDSPNERIVANTVEAMGQVRNPKCTDLILPKLGSRNNRVKANAALALFAAGHIEVIDSLKPMLMHSDPLMRSSAAFAIGELTLLAEREQLMASWKGHPHGVKMFLGELQESVPMLVSLLKDPEPMVKRQAIMALGKIKDKSSVLPIIDNIDLEKDSKEMIRDVSAALRAIGSHKLVRDVIQRLST